MPRDLIAPLMLLNFRIREDWRAYKLTSPSDVNALLQWLKDNEPDLTNAEIGNVIQLLSIWNHEQALTAFDDNQKLLIKNIIVERLTQALRSPLSEQSLFTILDLGLDENGNRVPGAGTIATLGPEHYFEIATAAITHCRNIPQDLLAQILSTHTKTTLGLARYCELVSLVVAQNYTFPHQMETYTQQLGAAIIQVLRPEVGGGAVEAKGDDAAAVVIPVEGALTHLCAIAFTLIKEHLHNPDKTALLNHILTAIMEWVGVHRGSPTTAYNALIRSLDLLDQDMLRAIVTAVRNNPAIAKHHYSELIFTLAAGAKNFQDNNRIPFSDLHAYFIAYLTPENLSRDTKGALLKIYDLYFDPLNVSLISAVQFQEMIVRLCELSNDPRCSISLCAHLSKQVIALLKSRPRDIDAATLRRLALVMSGDPVKHDFFQTLTEYAGNLIHIKGELTNVLLGYLELIHARPLHKVNEILSLFFAGAALADQSAVMLEFLRSKTDEDYDADNDIASICFPILLEHAAQLDVTELHLLVERYMVINIGAIDDDQWQNIVRLYAERGALHDKHAQVFIRWLAEHYKRPEIQAVLPTILGTLTPGQRAQFCKAIVEAVRIDDVDTYPTKRHVVNMIVEQLATPPVSVATQTKLDAIFRNYLQNTAVPNPLTVQNIFLAYENLASVRKDFYLHFVPTLPQVLLHTHADDVVEMQNTLSACLLNYIRRFATEIDSATLAAIRAQYSSADDDRVAVNGELAGNRIAFKDTIARHFFALIAQGSTLRIADFTPAEQTAAIHYLIMHPINPGNPNNPIPDITDPALINSFILQVSALGAVNDEAQRAHLHRILSKILENNLDPHVRENILALYQPGCAMAAAAEDLDTFFYQYVERAERSFNGEAPGEIAATVHARFLEYLRIHGNTVSIATLQAMQRVYRAMRRHSGGAHGDTLQHHLAFMERVANIVYERGRAALIVDPSLQRLIVEEFTYLRRLPEFPFLHYIATLRACAYLSPLIKEQIIDEAFIGYLAAHIAELPDGHYTQFIVPIFSDAQKNQLFSSIMRLDALPNIQDRDLVSALTQAIHHLIIPNTNTLNQFVHRHMLINIEALDGAQWQNIANLYAEGGALYDEYAQGFIRWLVERYKRPELAGVVPTILDALTAEQKAQFCEAIVDAVVIGNVNTYPTQHEVVNMLALHLATLPPPVLPDKQRKWDVIFTNYLQTVAEPETYIIQNISRAYGSLDAPVRSQFYRTLAEGSAQIILRVAPGRRIAMEGTLSACLLLYIAQHAKEIDALTLTAIRAAYTPPIPPVVGAAPLQGHLLDFNIRIIEHFFTLTAPDSQLQVRDFSADEKTAAILYLIEHPIPAGGSIPEITDLDLIRRLIAQVQAVVLNAAQRHSVHLVFARIIETNLDNATRETILALYQPGRAMAAAVVDLDTFFRQYAERALVSFSGVAPTEVAATVHTRFLEYLRIHADTVSDATLQAMQRVYRAMRPYSGTGGHGDTLQHRLEFIWRVAAIIHARAGVATGPQQALIVHELTHLQGHLTTDDHYRAYFAALQALPQLLADNRARIINHNFIRMLAAHANHLYPNFYADAEIAGTFTDDQRNRLFSALIRLNPAPIIQDTSLIDALAKAIHHVIAPATDIIDGVAGLNRPFELPVPSQWERIFTRYIVNHPANVTADVLQHMCQSLRYSLSDINCREFYSTLLDAFFRGGLDASINQLVIHRIILDYIRYHAKSINADNLEKIRRYYLTRDLDHRRAHELAEILGDKIEDLTTTQLRNAERNVVSGAITRNHENDAVSLNFARDIIGAGTVANMALSLGEPIIQRVLTVADVPTIGEGSTINNIIDQLTGVIATGLVGDAEITAIAQSGVVCERLHKIFIQHIEGKTEILLRGDGTTYEKRTEGAKIIRNDTLTRIATFYHHIITKQAALLAAARAAGVAPGALDAAAFETHRHYNAFITAVAKQTAVILATPIPAAPAVPPATADQLCALFDAINPTLITIETATAIRDAYRVIADHEHNPVRRLDFVENLPALLAAHHAPPAMVGGPVFAQAAFQRLAMEEITALAKHINDAAQLGAILRTLDHLSDDNKRVVISNLLDVYPRLLLAAKNKAEADEREVVGNTDNSVKAAGIAATTAMRDQYVQLFAKGLLLAPPVDAIAYLDDLSYRYTLATSPNQPPERHHLVADAIAFSLEEGELTANQFDHLLSLTTHFSADGKLRIAKGLLARADLNLIAPLVPRGPATLPSVDQLKEIHKLFLIALTKIDNPADLRILAAYYADGQPLAAYRQDFQETLAKYATQLIHLDQARRIKENTADIAAGRVLRANYTDAKPEMFEEIAPHVEAPLRRLGCNSADARLFLMTYICLQTVTDTGPGRDQQITDLTTFIDQAFPYAVGNEDNINFRIIARIHLLDTFAAQRLLEPAGAPLAMVAPNREILLHTAILDRLAQGYLPPAFPYDMQDVETFDVAFDRIHNALYAVGRPLHAHAAELPSKEVVRQTVLTHLFNHFNQELDAIARQFAEGLFDQATAQQKARDLLKRYQALLKKTLDDIRKQIPDADSQAAFRALCDSRVGTLCGTLGLPDNGASSFADELNAGQQETAWRARIDHTFNLFYNLTRVPIESILVEIKRLKESIVAHVQIAEEKTRLLEYLDEQVWNHLFAFGFDVNNPAHRALLATYYATNPASAVVPAAITAAAPTRADCNALQSTLALQALYHCERTRVDGALSNVFFTTKETRKARAAAVIAARAEGRTDVTDNMADLEQIEARNQALFDGINVAIPVGPERAHFIQFVATHLPELLNAGITIAQITALHIPADHHIPALDNEDHIYEAARITYFYGTAAAQQEHFRQLIDSLNPARLADLINYFSVGADAHRVRIINKLAAGVTFQQFDDLLHEADLKNTIFLKIKAELEKDAAAIGTDDDTKIYFIKCLRAARQLDPTQRAALDDIIKRKLDVYLTAGISVQELLDETSVTSIEVEAAITQCVEGMRANLRIALAGATAATTRVDAFRDQFVDAAQRPAFNALSLAERQAIVRKFVLDVPTDTLFTDRHTRALNFADINAHYPHAKTQFTARFTQLFDEHQKQYYARLRTETAHVQTDDELRELQENTRQLRSRLTRLPALEAVKMLSACKRRMATHDTTIHTRTPGANLDRLDWVDELQYIGTEANQQFYAQLRHHLEAEGFGNALRDTHNETKAALDLLEHEVVCLKDKIKRTIQSYNHNLRALHDAHEWGAVGRPYRDVFMNGLQRLAEQRGEDPVDVFDDEVGNNFDGLVAACRAELPDQYKHDPHFSEDAIRARLVAAHAKFVANTHPFEKLFTLHAWGAFARPYRDVFKEALLKLCKQHPYGTVAAPADPLTVFCMEQREGFERLTLCCADIVNAKGLANDAHFSASEIKKRLKESYKQFRVEEPKLYELISETVTLSREVAKARGEYVTFMGDFAHFRAQVNNRHNILHGHIRDIQGQVGRRGLYQMSTVQDFRRAPNGNYVDRNTTTEVDRLRSQRGGLGAAADTVTIANKIANGSEHMIASNNVPLIDRAGATHSEFNIGRTRGGMLYTNAQRFAMEGVNFATLSPSDQDKFIEQCYLDAREWFFAWCDEMGGDNALIYLEGVVNQVPPPTKSFSLFNHEESQKQQSVTYAQMLVHKFRVQILIDAGVHYDTTRMMGSAATYYPGGRHDPITEHFNRFKLKHELNTAIDRGTGALRDDPARAPAELAGPDRAWSDLRGRPGMPAR